MPNLCIIPARMGSSRFPGKPLAPINGLALVLHVFERCRLCTDIDRVVIATCDEEIRVAATAHGAETIMTADTHPGCVDRTDEAVSLIGGDLAEDDFVLMVQGDEIFVMPDMLTNMVAAFGSSESPVVNLVSKIHNVDDHDDPNVVKVVGDPDGRALFFSRAPIPFRNRANASSRLPLYQQTGVIGFSKEFVHRFGALEQTPLEKIEHIDMMRRAKTTCRE